MKVAESGNTVSIHYCGKFTDGEIFDQSIGKDPLKFVLGAHQVIEGFEEAILGMKVNDKSVVNIPCEKAYGKVDPELVFEMPRTGFPPEINLEVGLELALSNQDGEQLPVRIKEITPENIVLDANHPLAGKELVFEIQLMSIE